MPPKDLQAALHVDLPKDRKFYKERANKSREELNNTPTHVAKIKGPEIDVKWNQEGTRTVQAG